MSRLAPIIALLLIVAAFVVLRNNQSEARIAPASAVGGLSGVASPLEGTAMQVPTLMPTQGVPPSSFVEAAPGVVPYIPILMYHYVRYVDPAADPLGYNLSVTPEQFTAQLEWLKQNGYETVRMDVVNACLRGQGVCPARAVALTFDDGYSDAYAAAFPLLQHHGFNATFYIVSDWVGQPGYMNWDELRALQNAGMEIGAHTRTHPDLTTLGYDDALNQISQSRAALSAQLGAPIESFCYPAGRFTADTVAIVQAAGYTNATTTMQEGPQQDLYTLPRIRIYGDMSQAGFEQTIRAYLP